MKFLSLLLSLAYCMDVEPDPKVIKSRWKMLNDEILNGQKAFVDVFLEYLSLGKLACPELSSVYDSKSLPEFAVSIMKETIYEVDDFCLIRAQQILKYSEMPKINVDVDMSEWSSASDQALSIVHDICLNLGIDADILPPMPMYDVQFNSSLCRTDHGTDKMNLKILALALGDGAITNEVDLSGTALEGGDPSQTACYLISAFQSIKEKYLKDDASPFRNVIDTERVDKMISNLKKAVVLLNLMFKLAQERDGYEKFEDLVIRQLRKLDEGDDILLLSTFTEHAVALSIKKTGPAMFEVLLFNSGAGLNSHESVEIGMDVKYFPAKRFVNIPLAALKRLGVIKKVAELTAVSMGVAEPVQKRDTNVYTEQDLYDFALAPLNDYAYSFTADDIHDFRLIPDQRSGVCAYRCLWAYFAFSMNDSFRPMKLLTAKETLDRSFANIWSDLDKPVARRLLKFAMENYARSVRRYRKRDAKSESVPIKMFGDRKFWRMYRLIKTQTGIKKPRVLKVDTSRSVSSTGGAGGIKADGEAIMTYFDAFQIQESRIKLMKDEAMMIPTVPPNDLADLSAQIDAVLYVSTVSANWYLSNSRDRLGVIVNYVNELLPEPTKSLDFWDSVFHASNEDEVILQKLFRLLQRLLYYQQLDDYIYPSTNVAALKLFAVFHKSMIMVYPAFASCLPLNFMKMEPDLMTQTTMYSMRYLFVSSPAYKQYERLRSFLSDGCKEKCEGEDLTKSPLGNYLSTYIDKIKWSGLMNGMTKVQLMHMYGVRTDTVILPHHYFWRDARNFYIAIEKFDKIQKTENLQDSFNVYTSCQYGGKGSLDVQSIQSSSCKHHCSISGLPFAHQPAAFVGLPGIASPKIDSRYAALSFEGFCKAVSTNMHYTDKDRALHFNLTYGIDGGIDRLYTLLMNDDGSAGWRVLVTLSTHSIMQMDVANIAPEFLDSFAELLEYELGTRIRDLMGERQKLSRGSVTSLKMVEKVGRCSGFLVILAQFISRANLTGHHQSVLLQYIRGFYNIFDLHETGSEYMSYFTMAYILAHQGLDFTVEMAQKILLVNQRLAESRNIFKDDIDKTTYAFEAQTIFMKAFMLLSKDDNLAKDSVLTKRNDRERWRVSLPLIEIDENHHVDLLSGDHYIEGVKQSGVGNSEIDEAFKLCNFDRERLKFSSASLIAKEGCKMMTLNVNSLTTRTLRRHDGTVTKLESIQVYYEKDKAFLKEKFSDGSFAYLVPRTKEEWKFIALPATDDSEKPYQIFYHERYDAEPEVFFEHTDILIWFTSEGRFVFDNELSGLEARRLDDKVEGAFVNPLADQETCSLFRASHDGSWFFLFKYYSDHSGRPLWLRQDPITLLWHLYFDQKYHFSKLQYFAKSEYLHNFLVVENDDGSVRKVIFPVEHYALKDKSNDKKDELPRGKEGYMIEFDQSNLDVLKSTMMISLTKEGKLKPASRYESLLLAYKYLAGREYLDAFTQLLRVHQIEPFTSSELKLLGWISISFSAIRDGSPDSVAVRAYAAFLVYANNKLFDVLPLASEDAAQDKAPSPYADDKEWLQYWGDSILGTPCYKVVDSYLNLRSKISVTLRFDYKTGRDLITRFEERTWMEELDKKGPQMVSPRSSIKAYLNIGSEAAFEVSNLKKITPIKLDKAIDPAFVTTPGMYDEKKRSYPLSSFHPENMEKMVYKLFNHYLFGSYSGYEAESYLEYFYSLKNTKFNGIACKLISVLEARRYGNISAECRELKIKCQTQPAGAPRVIKTWTQNCVELYQKCFNSFKTSRKDCKIVAGKSFTYSQLKPAKRHANNSPDGELETLKLDVGRWGDYENLNQLKKTMLEGDIGDEDVWDILDSKYEELFEGLTKVNQAIQESINMSKGKDSKLPLETEIRRIAKGVRSIDENDILHLYAHASKRMYHQYFPEVNESDYQSIHDLCTEYAVLKVHLNDIQRLMDAIKSRDDDEASWKIEVKKRQARTNTTDNIILAYEIFINSRLTNRQYNDIKEMTRKENGKFTNKVIQRMMSAGKTFILGTILSMLKADKESLSVLVVPRSLYSSEASSLISRTFNAFGSAGFSFKINRESSEKTTERLIWLSEAIENALGKGKYIIVSPEMLLTMQNRFTEIVLENKKTHSKEFGALKKILKIFRDHGTATFDEIDMIFDPTQELNFPLASTKHEADEELKVLGTMMTELYLTLLDPEFLKIADIRKNITIHTESYDAIKPLLIKSMTQKLIKKEFILPNEHAFVYSCNDPEAKLTEFFSVLANSFDRHARTILEELSDDDLTRKLLSMLRLAINDWILTSWSGNVSENYGMSSSCPFSIPYASAGVAKEGSEFSFRWLTYARTIRMYLVQGLDQERLVSVLTWLQNWALDDISSNIAEDRSLPFRLSKHLFGKDPFAFDTDIPEQIDECLSTLRLLKDDPTYTKFLMLWIGHEVIPSVKFYEKQISANSQDFLMMFSSIQGYTGTIASVKVLPPVFHPEDAIDLQHKIEIRIKGKVRSDEVNKIVGMPEGWEVLTVPLGQSAEALWQMENIKSVVSSMEKAGHPLNAVIDVGAYFKDESNEAVADSMLSLKPSVLYFSTKLNKLALKTGNDKERMIKTISRASLVDLGIHSADRITFYDQQHCTGVDIFQHDLGFALVIIGLRTTTRDFNQAIMRMRKYLQDQKIVIIVPDIVANTILGGTGHNGIRVDDVISFLKMNMDEKIKTQNSLAMSHILRTHYKKPIYDLFLDVDSYFDIKCTANDMWVKSTETSLEQQILPLVEKPFKDYMHESLDIYDTIISGSFEREKLEIIRAGAEHILEEAVSKSSKEYPKTVSSSLIEDNDQMIENEVEAAKMIDLENENEMESQTIFSPMNGTCGLLDFNDPTFPEKNQVIWGIRDENGWVVNLRKYLVEILGFKMMADVIGHQVYASTSFIKHLFGRNRSRVFYILWLEAEENAEPPKAVIIDSSEAKLVKNHQKEKMMIFGHYAWLMTADGVMIGPSLFKSQVDKSVLADVLIFAGMTKILETQEWIPYFQKWLGSGEDRIRKSMIYRNIILSSYEGKKALLGPLGTSLKVSELEESTVVSQHEYQKLHLLAGNSSAVKDYMKRLAKTGAASSYKLLLDMSFIYSKVFGDHLNERSMKVFKQGLKYLMSDVGSTGDVILDAEDHSKILTLKGQVTKEYAITAVRDAILLLKTIGNGHNKAALKTFISILHGLLIKLDIRPTPTATASKLKGLLPSNKSSLLKPAAVQVPSSPIEPSINAETQVALEFLEFIIEAEFADNHFKEFLKLFILDWRHNKFLSPKFDIILAPFIKDPRGERILVNFYEKRLVRLSETDITYKMAAYHGMNPGSDLRQAILKYAAAELLSSSSISFEDFITNRLKPSYPWITPKDLLIEATKTRNMYAGSWICLIRVFFGENGSTIAKDSAGLRAYVRKRILEAYGVDIDAK